jgi:flavin-dependent dehydrogenase
MDAGPRRASDMHDLDACSHIFDLLIIGAGPAGCATAIRAANKGLTVGIIERTRFPRNVPGEALHPDIERLLDELGVTDSVFDASFVRYPGWLLENANGTTYIPFAEPPAIRFGFQAWRAELDSILLARARDLGCLVLEDTQPSEPLVSSGRVVGVDTVTNRLTAKHVVDATGARRWLSRRLGLAATSYSPKLIARYGYSADCPSLGSIPRFQEHDAGWTWLARVRDRHCQCVQLALAPDAEVPTLSEALGFPRRLRGADVTWSRISGCAGPGYFLCGDAAATLDPAATSGVARAMASGIKVADVIVEVESGAVGEIDGARAYRESQDREFTAEMLRLASRYSALENPPRWIEELHTRLAAGELPTVERFARRV